MENIIFLQPLLGILAFWVGCIGVFLYYRTQKFASKFAFMWDIEAIFWKTKFLFQFNIIVLFVIIVSFALLIADPNLKKQNKQVVKNWIDIAIVLDLSYSMVAEDIPPNRLEVAKQVISDFTSKLTTDRVGLVLFSGKPFTSVPLTFDYQFITNYVQKLSIESINQDYQHLQWTAIWDGLLYGANLFDDQSERQKVIVLFTDWEANRWIDPIEAIRYIKQKNIIVHTVGIGGQEETYVNFKNIYGNQKLAIWWIDEENLQAIANMTGWEYYRADSKETFQNIFEKLDLLQKKEIQVDEYQFFVPYYKNFVLLIFILLVLYMSVNSYYYIRK